MAEIKCFACDKSCWEVAWLVACEDEQIVNVGPECYRKIKKAGAEGYQPPKGGPRLYLEKFKPVTVTE